MPQVAGGYGDVTHFGPDEAQARYFAGRDDVHFGGNLNTLTDTVLTAHLRAPGPQQAPHAKHHQDA